MDTDSLYEDVPVRDPSGGARGHDVPQGKLVACGGGGGGGAQESELWRCVPRSELYLNSWQSNGKGQGFESHQMCMPTGDCFHRARESTEYQVQC